MSRCNDRCFHRGPNCAATSSNVYICTLPAGHEGPHVACSMDRCNVEIWDGPLPTDQLVLSVTVSRPRQERVLRMRSSRGTFLLRKPRRTPAPAVRAAHRLAE